MQNTSAPNGSLIHRVVVDPTDEIYEYHPFDSDFIKGPIKEWLAENVRHGRNWEMERAPERGGRKALVFRFADADEACAFRVVWG